MKKIACIRLLAGMTALVMLSGVLTAAAEDPKPRKPMAAQGPALCADPGADGGLGAKGCVYLRRRSVESDRHQ